jgi:hypothetical protein
LADDAFVSLHCREVERSQSKVVARRGIRAGAQQILDHSDMPTDTGYVKWRAPERTGGDGIRPQREQRSDRFRVAVEGGDVKRSAAWVLGWFVEKRSRLREHHDQVSVIMERGKVQDGAERSVVRGVRICTSEKQRRDDSWVAGCRCPADRRPSVDRPADVGPVLDQQGNDIGVPHLGSPHQRRLFLIDLLKRDTALYEPLSCLKVSSPRGFT